VRHAPQWSRDRSAAVFGAGTFRRPLHPTGRVFYRRVTGKEAERSRGSQNAAVLAGSEHSQHPHVAGGLVEAGVRMHPIQRPIASVTGQLSHA
jgi:hypothetical protein